MGGLVGKNDIIAFYGSLWRESASSDLPSFLSAKTPLPPFLCRRLAFGDQCFPVQGGWLEAMAGSSSALVRRLDAGRIALHWAVGGMTPQAFHFLRLEGHRMGDATPQREKLLSEAIALLNQLDGPFAASVADFTGLVVWIEQFDPAVSSLTSSSFPALPHSSFFTNRAAREVLPDTILPEERAWPLAENLYHESLHQQLSATILQEELFADDYDVRSSPRTWIPWRRASWEADRMLHALYVYSRLVPMRVEYRRMHELDPIEERCLVESLRRAVDSLAFLADAVERLGACFSADGLSLARDLVADVRSIVKTAAA